MPRPKTTLPAYCLHKTSGRAVVFVDRKPVYLGKYDSPESRRKYGEIVANLAKGIGPGSSRAKPDPGITVARLCLKYATEHLPRYSDDEQDCQRGAIRILRDLFGETPAADFGPLRLRTVQAAMIERGWSRGYINRQVKRLRFLFKWGVSWELVPKHTPEALRTVPSLGIGDSDAPESKPRRAIPDEQLQAVRAVLDGRNRDLFDLLLLTGARPGELLSLKTGDIDRSGELWRADLTRHKTAHQGKSRVLFFNAAAQLILQQYLSADPAKRLFSIRRDSFGDAIKDVPEPTVNGHQPASPRPQSGHQPRLLVDKWLRDCGVEFVAKQSGNRVIYSITCPFNPEHAGDANVTQFTSGAVSASCFHNSCQANDWGAFRERIGKPDPQRHYDPPMQIRTVAQHYCEGTAAARPARFAPGPASARIG
jgi:integrase